MLENTDYLMHACMFVQLEGKSTPWRCRSTLT